MHQPVLSRSSAVSSFQRAALGLVLAAAGTVATAAPLPSFTLDPAAVGLAGAMFSANNLLISDYSTITFTGGGFTDEGYLSISAAQTAAGTFTPAGLNSSYGLYIQFSGAGTTGAGNPTTDITRSDFTSLTYTIYGYNGTATFDFIGNTPTTSAVAPIALATGSLIRGSAVTIPDGDGSFTPSGSAKLTLTVLQPAFFNSPAAFYDLASTAFSNTSSQVEAFADGFRIRQGGGSVNFATTVPEPGSYALLLAGLAVIGGIARRKAARQPS